MRALIVAIVMGSTIGCVSPAQPSRVSAGMGSLPARVTVATTLSTVNGPALAGVRIAVDGDAVALTDTAGRATFGVAAGRELTIAVSHPRYKPFIPSATATIAAGAHETWRFAFVP